MKLYIKASDYYGDHEQEAKDFDKRFSEEYPDLSSKITYDISMMDEWGNMYFEFKYKIPGISAVAHPKYGDMIVQDSVDGMIRGSYPKNPSEDDLNATYEDLIHGNFVENFSKFVTISENYADCVNDVISYYENVNKKYNCHISLDIYLNIYRASLKIGLECNSTYKLNTVTIDNFNFDADYTIAKINDEIFDKFNIDDFSELLAVSDIDQTMVEIHYVDYTSEWREQYSNMKDLGHDMDDIDDAVKTLYDNLSKFDCIYQLQQADFDSRYYFLIISSYEETEKIKQYVNKLFSKFTDLRISYSRGTSYQLEKEWKVSKMISEYEEKYMV